MKLELFAGVENTRTALDFHAARHGVLVSNLANAATPKYRPKDLVFQPQRQNVQLAGTQPAHFATASDGTADFSVREEPAGRDDAGVRMEQAMAKVSANKVRYTTALEITRRQLAALRYAATDGRGQ